MRTYTAATDVGHTTTLHNYQYGAEQSTEPPTLATDDPEPTGNTDHAERTQPEPKHWRDKLEMANDFLPQLIRFQGNIATPATEASVAVEIIGPPRGYCWDIRRIAVSTSPWSNNSVQGSGIYQALFFAVTPGNLTLSIPLLDNNPAVGLTGDLDLLGAYQSNISDEAELDSSFASTFSKWQATLLGGYNLGVIIIGGGNAANSYLITGQAVLVPEALIMTL